MPGVEDDELKKSQLQRNGAMIRERSIILLNNLVDERLHGGYCTGVFLAALVGLGHIFIGAVIISVVLYSTRTQDTHAALFAIAYNFFAAEGILSLSFINGWSTPMRKKHRKCAHVVLQMCAITCALIGAFTISGTLTQSMTIHGFSGLVTLILTGMNWTIGPFVLHRIRLAHVAHMIFGIACFVMSSFCLCSGLVTDPFERWASKEVTGILLGFVVFYSFCVVYTTLMKSVKMM